MKLEKLFGQFYGPRVGFADTQSFLGMLWVQVAYLKVVLWAPWMCSG